MHEADAAHAAGDAEVFAPACRNTKLLPIMFIVLAAVLAVIWGIFFLAERGEPQGFAPTLPAVFSLLAAFPFSVFVLAQLVGRYTTVTLAAGKLVKKSLWRREEVRLEDILYMRGNLLETASQTVTMPPAITDMERFQSRIAAYAPVVAENQAPPCVVPLRLHPSAERVALAMASVVDVLPWLLVTIFLVRLLDTVVAPAFVLVYGLIVAHKYPRVCTCFPDHIEVEGWLREYEIRPEQVRRVQAAPLPTLWAYGLWQEMLVLKWEGGWLHLPVQGTEKEITELRAFLAAQYGLEEAR